MQISRQVTQRDGRCYTRAYTYMYTRVHARTVLLFEFNSGQDARMYLMEGEGGYERGSSLASADLFNYSARVSRNSRETGAKCKNICAE